MTIVATLKQQHRNVLDYLTEACDAANWDRQAPSLLPRRCCGHWVESLSRYTLNGYHLKIKLFMEVKR